MVIFMQWEELLDQLEGQWDVLQEQARVAEIADLRDAEAGGLTWASRIHGSDQELELRLRLGEVVRGRVSRVGVDWILVRDSTQRWLIPFHAIASIRGLGSGGVELRGIAARLTARTVLREMAESGTPIRLKAGGQELEGRLSLVARDHLELRVRHTQLVVIWEAVAFVQQSIDRF